MSRRPAPTTRGRRHVLGYMLASSLALGLLALPSALLSSSASEGAVREEVEDSCLDCHSQRDFLVTNKKLYDYYQAWKPSVHAQEEVTCSDCHGGNPRSSDKEAAHQGEVTAAKRSSAVNFENIPATCGQCHEDIYKGYRQSSHFKHLIKHKQEPQGPSCVTCHGSVSVAVLNVNTVEAACSRCHNQETDNHPDIPDQARELLNKFLSIHRIYRYISVRGEPLGSREFLGKVDGQLHDLSVGWHTFDLEQIDAKTASILDALKRRRDEMRKPVLKPAPLD